MNAIVTSVITCLLVSAPEFNWFKSLEKNNVFFSVNKSSPIIYNSIIIVPFGSDLYGLRANDGKKLWYTKLKGKIQFSPAIYKDSVYVASESGYIYIIDYKNGVINKEIRIKNSSITSDFVFGEDVLFFRTVNEELISINLETGEVIWNYKRNDPGKIKIDSVPAPVLAGNTVIAGFSDGTITGVNIVTGREEWKINLPPAKKFEGIYATPLAIGNILIIPKYDSGLYAYDIDKKRILWAREDEGYQWCAESKPNLVCATISGKLLLTNPFSGNTYWFTDLIKLYKIYPKRKLLTFSQPVIFKEKLYFSTEMRIYTIDLSDGSIDWKFATPGTLFRPGITSKPFVDEGYLLFLTNNGILYNFKNK